MQRLIEPAKSILKGRVRTLEWIRPLALAGTLAVVMAAERGVPFFVGRRGAGHDARNLVLGLIGGLARVAAFPALLLVVCRAAASHHWGLLNRGDLNPWLSLPAGVVLLDGWAYLWHILNHKTPVLWRFHVVHHHDTEVDATTALRFHAGDVLMSAAATLIAVPIFGLEVGHILAYEALSMPLSIFHHANIRIPERADRVLCLLIVTPRMHLVHHSQWQPETDSNYSAMFSFWDRAFGTHRIRREPASIRFGLDGYNAHDHSTLRGCLLTPFGAIKSRVGPPPAEVEPARTLGPCPPETDLNLR
jgi:sterol desaturase/sphingolipid hydroxylase (fatty acid hydroxylase superfamily)